MVVFTFRPLVASAFPTSGVAAGILPAVEPGILPGGIAVRLVVVLTCECRSGRQDAALYGRQDACRWSLDILEGQS